MNTGILELKNKAKELSSTQHSLKEQRKTIKFQGQRTVEPDEARWKVLNNTEELRHLYDAYSILRGKEPQKYKRVTVNKDKINKLVEQYSS